MDIQWFMFWKVLKIYYPKEERNENTKPTCEHWLNVFTIKQRYHSDRDVIFCGFKLDEQLWDGIFNAKTATISITYILLIDCSEISEQTG